MCSTRKEGRETTVVEMLSQVCKPFISKVGKYEGNSVSIEDFYGLPLTESVDAVAAFIETVDGTNSNPAPSYADEYTTTQTLSDLE